MNLDAKYPEIDVKITGEDGNIFMPIALVSRALRRAGIDQEIVSQFVTEVTDAKSYDHALQIIMRWVSVT